MVHCELQIYFLICCHLIKFKNHLDISNHRYGQFIWESCGVGQTCKDMAGVCLQTLFVVLEWAERPCTVRGGVVRQEIADQNHADNYKISIRLFLENPVWRWGRSSRNYVKWPHWYSLQEEPYQKAPIVHEDAQTQLSGQCPARDFRYPVHWGLSQMVNTSAVLNLPIPAAHATVLKGLEDGETAPAGRWKTKAPNNGQRASVLCTKYHLWMT